MQESENLVDLFRFAEDDEANWPYLKEYRLKIEEFLQSRSFSPEQEIRYMLIGLFPLYRVKNLGSEDFSTNRDVLLKQGTYPQNIRQAEYFNEKAGFEITSSLHYYSLIKKKHGKKISANYLVDFVIEGKAEE